MSAQQATLTHLEDLGGDEWALRYSCKDSALWYEIKDTIMDADKSDRRWNPDECNGKGAWVVSGYVLEDLKRYFVNIAAWMSKNTSTNNVDDINSVPF